MNNYINYHSHSSISNLSTPDSTISNEDRTKRAIELGHSVVSYVEHGTAMSYLEGIPLSQKYHIKPLLGSEVYFVKDNQEKDRTNVHLILLAKNESGRKAINRIISDANTDGYYYKSRCDLKSVLSLPPKDVWVTTACLGGIWRYEDNEQIMLQLFEHFGYNNFFLEVQSHHVEDQKILNRKIIELSHQYNIRIIAGLDSHMIYPEQTKQRDDYLASRGIEYPEEKNWFLDFCDYQTFYTRFLQQNILNKVQIEEALDNTNIFDDVETYLSPIFDKNIIKLPTLYPYKTQDEKDEILKTLVLSSWNDEKRNISSTEHKHYEQEIQKELDTIIKTHTADYFLLDYEVVKKGRELGGTITMTGRGSAPSYYISKLLGLTTIDRISAEVKLFPERFISAERLLEAKSLPDVDLNLGTPEIFAQAQVEIMGEGHSYPMITFGKLRDLGAWKLYARTEGVSFEIANLVSDQIQQYESDLKHNQSDDDEEEHEINAMDYIEDNYKEIFQNSKQYLGLINSITVHPCAFLLYNAGDIREEFGLIKTKVGDTEHICACCEGHFAEDYKLLKNDLLKVSVVDMIHKIYNKIGVQPHPLPELIKICNNDPKVWQIYKNAWKMGVNQFEKSGTASRAVKYAPQNISEVSAFIAAIRPGFQSNYKQFEAREPFSYGIKSLDDLIQTKEFPYSYMIYQENSMQVLAYAGIPISETYEIVKNIAKKRAEKVYQYKDQFILGMMNRLLKEEHQTKAKAEEISKMTWQIIEDSSRYSFNASHSYAYAGDSLYCAYLKANYPLQFYEVFLQMMEEDGDKDRLSDAKIEAEEAFHIKFPPYRFGQDNRQITASGKDTITQSMRSIKGFGQKIGEELYELGQNYYDNFLDFLIDSEEKGYLGKKYESLIQINYFEQFGKNKKLYDFFMEFTKGKNRYGKKLTDKIKQKRIEALKEFWNVLPDLRFPIQSQLFIEEETLGQIQAIYPKIDKKYVYVKELDVKFAPRILAYCLNNGKTQSIKIERKIFSNNLFRMGDILFCKNFEKKNTVKFQHGQYIEVEGEYTWWLTHYDIIDNFDERIDQ